MKSILEADSIVKTFGGRELLTDCYIRCETGDILGILGRNGTGKSTLLKIIFGTMPADNRFVRVDGNVNYKRTDITYLPQHEFLPTLTSIRKVIALFIDDKIAREEIMQHERVKPHLHKRTTELSGGELRILETLLLLHLPSKFLLLDEPFTGIEPLYKEYMIALLQEYRKVKGIIITDHDYRNVLAVSDKIVLVTNGVCKHLRSAQELEQYGYLSEGMLGD